MNKIEGLFDGHKGEVMKIAQIAPPWLAIPPKNYGGTEIVLYNLVEEQVAQGHDVTLFAAGDTKTSANLVSFFPHPLIETSVPWQAHLKAYYHYHKTIEYIKAHRFDVIHIHLSSSADMYLFPLTLHLTTPIVVTLHSHFPFDRVQAWTGDADDYYLEWFAHVPMVAISQSARADVPYRLNFVETIHHGVPMERFKPLSRQPENYLVWLGRMMPEKGAHIAIQAAKKAGVPLILAGTVDRHVPTSVNYYEEAVKPLIDNQQIKYIGPVNMEQKVKLLSRSRGFLNPIDWEEPFGMVMIEAMATGCPVITFPRGAAPEIVIHGKNGFLARDMHEMVNYIAKLDQFDRTTVRAYAEEHFSVQVMAKKYIRVYQKVIASSQSEIPLPKISVKTPAAFKLPAPAGIKKAEPVQGRYQSFPVAKSKVEAESGF